MKDITIWEYAKEHNIAYDTVIAAKELVKFNPELDIFTVMLYPTDRQFLSINFGKLPLQ